ncbi:hypothetical protein DKP76_07015 [Falsochrobactrum shanghaiense]|uniref:Uncharacterized protein n=1 Tax=Falsochrobactrum shanghaiense TaxID=2201899 RepID=A0A316JA18_9HYPH|nr:hypothetical protein [Falsochrobactrum shanghaiense]PWL18807.1 hypothetical protein DKP76_07015 [Falsochrobactrum shanghaiense]
MTIEVGIALAIFGAIATAFWRMWGLIDAAGKKGEKAQHDLAAHKVHAAETFATKQGMQEQTAQLLRAIEGVGSRIDGLHERLDRAFEQKTGRLRS